MKKRVSAEGLSQKRAGASPAPTDCGGNAICVGATLAVALVSRQPLPSARNTNAVCRFDNSGFTIMELVVAVFIFSIVSYSLFAGLTTGDRIRGKANMSRNAAIIASNEAERIRGAALQGIRLPDTTYTETVSGAKYAVFRTNMMNDSSNIVLEDRTHTEIEIRVEPPNTSFPPYIFKLIQGYHQ